MNKLSSVSVLLAIVCGASHALAQDPAPPPDEAEDLELPATTTPVQPAPAQPEAAAASAAQAAQLERELADLRQRLARVEARERLTPPPRAAISPPRAESSPEGPVNLERTAFTRPIPTGLKVGGYVQAQYESNQLSEDQLLPGGVPLNQNRFLLRRARLRLDRGWEYASATLELDANTVNEPAVGIRRGEGSVFYRGKNPKHMPPLVMLTLGVTDIPFGFELADSARVRVFMERSLSSLALFPTEMDVGAKVSGAIAFFRYAVAVHNGQPVDTISNRFPRDPNSAKDVTGRFGVDISPSERLHIAGGTSASVGKGFHPGTEAVKPHIVWTDINEDVIVQPDEIQATGGTAALPSENFDRWAFGLDLELALETSLGATRLYGEAYLASNYDRGVFPADPEVSLYDVRHLGGYAAVVQDFTRYAFAGFRAAVYEPDADFLETRRGRRVAGSRATRTYSPVIGARLPDRASLSLQYDFIDDKFAKDERGVPTDAENNQWTVRLQVEL